MKTTRVMTETKKSDGENTTIIKEDTTYPKVKPGWKTTEFWASVVTSILMMATALGFVSSDQAAELNNSIMQLVVSLIQLIGVVLPIVVYAAGRAKVKQTW